MVEAATFEGWAVLELMGHRRLGGRVSEAQIAGASFIRIDMPADEAGRPALTQYYGAASIYCLTPTTEEVARNADRHARYVPSSVRQLTAPDGSGDPDGDGDGFPF